MKETNRKKKTMQETITKYQSYRNYYVGDKKRFARYTNQTTPEFIQ